MASDTTNDVTNKASDILAQFTHKSTDYRIHGEPALESLVEMTKALGKNLAGIRSVFDVYGRGHLVLLMGIAKYQARFPGAAIDLPEHPGARPPAPAFETPAEAETRRATYSTKLAAYNLYQDVQRAAWQFIKDCIEALYLTGIEDDYTGPRFSLAELVNWLYDNYGTMTEPQIETYRMRMMKQWQFSSPIQAMYKQVEDNAYYIKN